jgi:hypothetical protein
MVDFSMFIVDSTILKDLVVFLEIHNSQTLELVWV